MKNLFLSLTAILLVFGFSACSKEEASEKPKLSVEFITVTNSFKKSTAANFAFSDGFITLNSLEYEAETDSDSLSVDFELNGTVVIDFATGVSTPDIGSISIPAGTYEEIEIEVELLDENSQPSVVINGSYMAPDSQTHPIRFEFNSGETFEVEREGSIVFTENQSVIAEITFDPSLWFAGVTDDDMNNAVKNSDGVIVISETENTSIFDIVADGLDLATELEIKS